MPSQILKLDVHTIKFKFTQGKTNMCLYGKDPNRLFSRLEIHKHVIYFKK